MSSEPQVRAVCGVTCQLPILVASKLPKTLVRSVQLAIEAGSIAAWVQCTRLPGHDGDHDTRLVWTNRP